MFKEEEVHWEQYEQTFQIQQTWKMIMFSYTYNNLSMSVAKTSCFSGCTLTVESGRCMWFVQVVLLYGAVQDSGPACTCTTHISGWLRSCSDRRNIFRTGCARKQPIESTNQPFSVQLLPARIWVDVWGPTEATLYLLSTLYTLSSGLTRLIY